MSSVFSDAIRYIIIPHGRPVPHRSIIITRDEFCYYHALFGIVILVSLENADRRYLRFIFVLCYKSSFPFSLLIYKALY